MLALLGCTNIAGLHIIQNKFWSLRTDSQRYMRILDIGNSLPDGLYTKIIKKFLLTEKFFAFTRLNSCLCIETLGIIVLILSNISWRDIANHQMLVSLTQIFWVQFLICPDLFYVHSELIMLQEITVNFFVAPNKQILMFY